MNVEGSDGIPTKIWKCVGENGFACLPKLFNKINRSKKMPNELKKSIMAPIYKRKGNI